MTKEQTALLNSRMAVLRREFKRRLEGLEHEHVMRLMALFQQFKLAAFAIRNGRPMDSPGQHTGGNEGGDAARAARLGAGNTAL